MNPVRSLLFLALAALATGCAAHEPTHSTATTASSSAVRAAPPTAPSRDARATAPAAPDAGRGGRLRPPAALACDRNHLTSYTGAVSGYRRDARQTWLEISTDEDTVEAVTVDHAGQADASAQFLLWNEPFAAGDWAKIEKARGQLHEGMRATAWVCDDGVTAPVIDWQPPRAD